MAECQVPQVWNCAGAADFEAGAGCTHTTATGPVGRAAVLRWMCNFQRDITVCSV